ncbi:MAG TPA: M13 family metallopeptidase, partial [Thermoplasmata archaeon]|nr:M13 family metallopeptidase [Thermoplasmata archaeon]
MPRFSVEHMDRPTDPSVDFYRYAVGRWLATHPVPADKSRWGAFGELTQRNFELLRGVLEASARDAGPASPAVQRLVGDFYASATDTERIEQLGMDPLREELDRVARIRTVDDLLRTVARFHRMGVGGYFSSYVYPDKKDSSTYAFYLGQGGLSMPDREYYLSERFAPQAEAFRRHVSKGFALLGEGPDGAAASAATVVGIETALARASRSRTDLRDEEKNYHKVRREDLVGNHPHTPWAAYLEERELPEVPAVVVGQPEFLETLDRLLEERPISDGQTYLRWHLLHASAPFLHDAVEREDFEFFHRTLMGQQEPEPRWLRATRVLDGAIGEAVGQLYVERYFPPEAKTRMTELVDDLRAVFRDRLAQLSWMTEGTRQKALAKFDRFTAKIGHPDTFREYSSIRIDRGDYLGNVRRSEEFESHRQAVRVGGPVDRTEWGM